MKSSRIIYTLIGATIILILVNTIFYLKQAYLNDRYYISVKKTYETIATASLLQKTLFDAESGQRGYLLTGDTAYLKPFIQTDKQIPAIYNKLDTLVKEHKQQVPRLNKLKELISIKRREMQYAIRLKQKGEYLLSDNLVKSNFGMGIMDQIRIISAQIGDEEKKLLNVKNQSIDSLSIRIQVFSIISNWVLLVIVVSALITIVRNRQKIAALFTQVANKTELLEHQKAELQNLSKGLIKQNTKLERFAYVASHDLRSPAVNQKALLQLYNDAKSEEERSTYITHMHDLADSLAEKLNDLVEVLRSEYDSSDLQQNLKFEEICHTVITNLTADIKSSHAAIDCDFSEAPDIDFPKSYLESIMQNLVSNALKYRHPDRHPHISISTFRLGKKTCFRIADNGLGIDLDKNKGSIFGLFKTFHKDHDSKGVGLYVTKAQVTAMGGDIEVDSTPEVGTTFTVTLG